MNDFAINLNFEFNQKDPGAKMFKLKFIQLLSALLCFSAQTYALDSSPPASISQNEAIMRLVEGNKRFIDNKLTYCTNVLQARSLAQQQHSPVAAILSCADARVGPEMVFDQGLGDLFIVRIAGNVVSDFGIGSLEYAVKYLGVPLIVVLGHTHCGAMDAFLKTLQKEAFLEGYIENLVLAAYPASKLLKNLNSASLNEMIAVNVQASRDQLIATSQIIGKGVEEGKLKVVGAVYDLESGLVTFLDK